jgi:translation initiation factor IF-3
VDKGRKEEQFRINDFIKVPQVRLVGENITSGIYDIKEAKRIAAEQQLDLVEISPNANPPVCKIIDYSKFKYEQKKKQKELKAKAVKVVVKEIRFSPNTDDHDFNFKLTHAKNFFSEGAKLKAYVHFVGRSIVYKERGEELLLRFAQALEEFGKVDQLPKLEGKRMFLLMSPKSVASPKSDKKSSSKEDNKGKSKAKKEDTNNPEQ